MSRLDEMRPFEGTMKNAPGHWVMAALGKKVLRPGGRELSKTMIDGLNITELDDVVEFAPGMGVTADVAIAKNPRTYTAVDKTPQVVEKLNIKYTDPAHRCIEADATATGLDDGCATVLYAEAMLTMHPDRKKLEIISEASRLLQAGGRFGLHEIALTEHSSDEEKKQARADLTREVKHSVVPIEIAEWTRLLNQAGLEVQQVQLRGMLLLEPARVIADEGFFPMLAFIGKVMMNRQARSRILAMRRVFKKHDKTLNAVMFLCKKRTAPA